MRKLFKTLILFIVCFSFGINTYAKEKNTLYQAGDNVKIKDELDGSAFIAGNDVVVDAKINGIGFIAGKYVKVNSESEYLLSAGMELEIKGDVLKETFLAGSDIKIKGATLKRDVYIAGSIIEIDSTIERNASIVGESVSLKGTYNGNITIEAANITIEDGTEIKGTLKYNEDAVITGLNDNINTKTYINNIKKLTIVDTLKSYLSVYIHVAILGIVIVFLFESKLKMFEYNKERMTSTNILKTCGKGFLILIGVPLVGLMMLISSLFSTVGLITVLIYIIMLLLSTIVSSYVLMDVLKKYLFKKELNNYLTMIIGILIVQVLCLIPIIGGFISFIVLIFGLGTIGEKLMLIKEK